MRDYAQSMTPASFQALSSYILLVPQVGTPRNTLISSILEDDCISLRFRMKPTN